MLQTETSGKYNSPLYFCFLSLFFYHSCCRKDQFTVLNLKVGTQDFTNPRSRGPSLVCRCGFAFTSVEELAHLASAQP